MPAFPLADITAIATMIRDGSAKTLPNTFGHHVINVETYGLDTFVHDSATAMAAIAPNGILGLCTAEERAALADCHAALVGAIVDAGLDLPVAAEPVGKLGDGHLLQGLISLITTYGPILWPIIQGWLLPKPLPTV